MYQCKVYDATVRDHKKIYHYTTLDSLKKIAETRTLLFNRCDNVNDLIEGSRSKVKYYVSSFTYYPYESIPMWYMYSRGRNGSPDSNIGVRLCVENEDFFTGKVYLNPGNKGIKYDISKFDSVFCGKTIYDDRNKDRSPSRGTINSALPIQYLETDVHDLGLRGKGTAWSFEKEVRFYTLDSPSLFADRIFVELHDVFFDKLSITFSPLISEHLLDYAKREVDELLGEEHWVESDLKGSIRLY